MPSSSPVLILTERHSELNGRSYGGEEQELEALRATARQQFTERYPELSRNASFRAVISAELDELPDDYADDLRTLLMKAHADQD